MLIMENLNFMIQLLFLIILFKQGITIFMIAKIILIVFSIIGSFCCYSWTIYKNDLGEFDSCGSSSRYDNQEELNKIYQEKDQVVSFLNKKTNN